MKVTEITAEAKNRNTTVVQRAALSPVAFDRIPERISDSVAVRQRPDLASQRPMIRAINIRGLLSGFKEIPVTSAHQYSTNLKSAQTILTIEDVPSQDGRTRSSRRTDTPSPPVSQKAEIGQRTNGTFVEPRYTMVIAGPRKPSKDGQKGDASRTGATSLRSESGAAPASSGTGGRGRDGGIQLPPGADSPGNAGPPENQGEHGSQRRVTEFNSAPNPEGKIRAVVAHYPEMTWLTGKANATPEFGGQAESGKTIGEKLFPSIPRDDLKEFNRTAVSLLALDWILSGDYDAFTACQGNPATRLSVTLHGRRFTLPVASFLLQA